MTLKRWDGASFVDLTTLKRWDGASWIDITIAKRWDGASWVDVGLVGGGGSLSATVNDGFLTTAGNSGEEMCPDVFSQTCTVTATGGTGPYTYAWTYVSGNASVQCSLPTSNVTSFLSSICHGSKSAVWKCTVTDSLAATDSVNVSISLTL